jgi:AcrR family transcriptional regulator
LSNLSRGRVAKMARQIAAPRRVPLSRDRVLRAAVSLADDAGIESLSMRKLAEELGVVPMALYKHVANKEELLDGMIDVVIGEIDPPMRLTDWKSAIRQRILSARQALLRHPWAPQVIESKKTPTPVVLAYMDSMIGLFRAGGFSVSLTHHVMHTIGSRVMGFTQELFNDSRTVDPEIQAVMMRELGPKFPNVLAIAMAASHEGESVVGQGCDDQFEFEFALDLLLDGFERLRRQERFAAAPPP